MGKKGLTVGGWTGAALFTVGWVIFAVGTYMAYGDPWFYWSLAGVVLTAIGGGLAIIMGLFK